MLSLRTNPITVKKGPATGVIRIEFWGKGGERKKASLLAAQDREKKFSQFSKKKLGEKERGSGDDPKKGKRGKRELVKSAFQGTRP